MKKLRVTVEGKTYEVLVEMLDATGLPAATNPPLAAAPLSAAPSAPLSAPIAAAAAPRAATASASAGDVPSPLAGKVVSIDVKAGQSVDEGSQVATVEAMKMNTYIYAPKTGVVSAILVNPGDGVEEGTALLRIG
jgi:glutaconyl-CoA/methylmalonyl-CoA decarboxylase subunit gamma